MTSGENPKPGPADHPFLRIQWLRSLLRVLAIFLSCHELARLSVIFPPGGPYPHLIWLPEGANLAVIVLFGWEAWAGVLLAQWVSGTGLAGAFCSTAACALRMALAQGLLTRLRFHPRLVRLRDFVLLVIAGTIVATGLGTLGGSVLSWGLGFLSTNEFWSGWRIWWTGDTAGILILTPLILTWADPVQRRSLAHRWQEFCVLFVSLLAVNFWVSSQAGMPAYARYPLAYPLSPLLIWAALRFGPIGVTTAGLAAFIQSLWSNWAPWQTAARAHALTAFPLPMVEVSFAWLMTLILAFAVQDLYRARESVKATHQALSTLVQTSPLAIVALNAQREVMQWNQAASAMFGWSDAETLGKLLLLPGWDHLRDLLEEAFSGHTVSCTRSGQFRRDGERIDVQVDAAPMRAADGAIIASVAILADVTAQRRMENELQQGHHLEALGRLAGGIAHDFNNILSVILGQAELFLVEVPDAGLHHRISRLRKAVLQASKLTSRLLAFSRQRRIEPVVLDLNAVVHELAQSLRERLDSGMDLILNLDSADCPVLVDQVQCEQLVANLCLNAEEGNEQIRSVEIATRALPAMEERMDSARSVVLSVRYHSGGAHPPDSVHGKSNLPRDGLYYRSGLGLAIVHGIARQAGATMQVWSEAEQGTRIEVTFPAFCRSEDDVSATRRLLAHHSS